MLELLVVVLLCVIGLIVFFGWRKDQTNRTMDYLKQDINTLSRSVEKLSQSVSDDMKVNHQSMSQQLQQSSRLVADVTQRLTKLDETNRRVVDVADELKTLQNVLQNPKQRGVFGEYYLETVLQNVLSTKNYQMQYKFQDGQIVDAVIFLDKKQILPIDSKFSLENYNRMVAETSKLEKERLLNKVRADLKARIDETSKYVRSKENTMDFAFMFIPSESLYYDLLVGGVGSGTATRDLIEYAYLEKKVIVVSPTIFMAYLQTVLHGLRSLQIDEQAKQIQLQVGELKRHLVGFDDYLKRLGKTLGQTVGHYNSAYKEFGKIDRDVVKISGGEVTTDPVLLDRPSEDL